MVLELINEDGHSLWSFPSKEILKDLLEVIKFTVSGTSDLINSLLSEEFRNPQITVVDSKPAGELVQGHEVVCLDLLGPA